MPIYTVNSPQTGTDFARPISIDGDITGDGKADLIVGDRLSEFPPAQAESGST